MKAKRFVTGFCVAAFCVSSSLVMAGMRHTSEVNVNLAYSAADGTMTDARGSADTRQFISCYHYYESAGTTLGYCQAGNSVGIIRSCVTTDYQMVQVIRSVSAESHISFSWNKDGTCRVVLVTNTSINKPASATGF